MSEGHLYVVSSTIGAWTTVPPDASITVRFNRSIERRSAQHGFRMIAEDLRGEVRVSADGTEATWTPSSLPCQGEHTLLVEDIVAQEGGSVFTPWRLPFVVADSESPVWPYGQILLHSSTTHLRMSDRQYSISKLMDPRSGARREIAADERGQVVDLAAILREDARLLLEKYGKIHPLLYDEIARAEEQSRLPVALWVHIDEQPVDKSQFDLDLCEEPPEALLEYRERIKEAQTRFTEQLRHQGGIEVKAALTGVPVLFLELTGPQVRELARIEEVAGLFLHETAGIDDLKDSMAVSGADIVVKVQGWRGTGVRVAVWEAAPDDESRLAVVDHFQPVGSFKTPHARLVTGIIQNRSVVVTDVHGHRNHGGYAPGCRIYSANTYWVEGLSWAVVHRECRVINQSFHRPFHSTKGLFYLDDQIKDELALNYPYPMIVQAAGDTSEEPVYPTVPFVHHESFNSLRVGNHNDSRTAMDAASLYRNPTTPHGDRELPELCANGTDVKAVGVTTNNNSTSFSAPAVSGSVALLHQMHPRLRSWPEACRAILLAGAVNVVGRSWWKGVRAGVDSSDGAGGLDIAESARIARSPKSRDSDGAQRGWDVGTLNPESFDDAGDWRHSYRVHVPTVSRGGLVKVALAWNADPRNGFPYRLIDYDLYVFDGSTLVAWSASWDNNYEIAEFRGEPGRTYTIRIYQAPEPPNLERFHPRYYGLAWTVRLRGIERLKEL